MEPQSELLWLAQSGGLAYSDFSRLYSHRSHTSLTGLYTETDSSYMKIVWLLPFPSLLVHKMEQIFSHGCFLDTLMTAVSGSPYQFEPILRRS